MEGELERLVSRRLLTREQADMVDCDAIVRFFETELGRKLRGGITCIREFKFSILDAGSHYGPGLQQEQVLLQGVVDCALIEEDGITVIDFKTDFATEQNLSQLAEHYAPQVQTYAKALERIYGQRVKQSVLYFFALGKAVTVE